MTETPPQQQPEGGDDVEAHIAAQKPKVLFAVGLAGVMLTLSLTLAGVTAYYLIQGEEGAAVHNTLPADCAWVLESHEGLAADVIGPLAGSAVQTLGVLGVDLAGPSTQAALFQRFVQTPELQTDAGIGLCGRGGAVVATVGFEDSDAAVSALEGWMRDTAGGTGSVNWSEAVGGFRDGHVRKRDGAVPAAILRSEARAVAVTGTSTASKELAAVAAATREASLRTHNPFREGIERVGGHIRLWLSGDHLRTITDVAGASWMPLLGEHASWLAASIRPDGGERVFHLHIGAEQKGIGWLKSRLDPIGVFDAAQHLDRQATAAVVLRLNPTAWISNTTELRRWPLVGEAEDALKKATGKSLKTIAAQWRGHLLYQRIGKGWRLDVATGTAADPTIASYAQPAALLDKPVQPGHVHAATFAEGCGVLLESGARAQLLWFHTGLVATAHVPVDTVARRRAN